MERLKKMIANWFGFSRTEVNGFLVLLPLMVLIIFSHPIYKAVLPESEQGFSKDHKRLDSLLALMEVRKDSTARKGSLEKKAVSIFAFDPNITSQEDLQKLGFSKILSTRIVGYRQKGGVFRVKRDLMKIYDMDSTLYHQVYAYIQLPEELENNYVKTVSTSDEKKKKHFEAFDLNLADTTQLEAVYGIGPVLAKRIVKFRDALGGFVHPDQLSEVYGIDSLVLKKLKQSSFITDHFEPKKLNINTSDEIQLSSHPYIKKTIAKTIVAYRFQHGTFSDPSDVLKISTLEPRLANRIIPYLKIKD